MPDPVVGCWFCYSSWGSTASHETGPLSTKQHYSKCDSMFFCYSMLPAFRTLCRKQCRPIAQPDGGASKNYEMLKQVMKFFGDVELFLRVGDEHHGGTHFVSATYYLEGDGSRIFCCYKRLAASHSAAVEAYRSFEGVARRQADGNVRVSTISLLQREKHAWLQGTVFSSEI